MSQHTGLPSWRKPATLALLAFLSFTTTGCTAAIIAGAVAGAGAAYLVGKTMDDDQND